MKRSGISLVLALALSIMIAPIAFAAVTLPDYEKMTPVDKVACDNGTTSYVTYEIEDSTLVVIATKDKTLYNLMNTSGEYFMYKTAGSAEIKNISKAEANVLLKESAPNFYNAIFRAGPSDCK